MWPGNGWPPIGIAVLNPAFDVTPHSLITAILTEKGILKPPFRQSISKALKKAMSW